MNDSGYKRPIASQVIAVLLLIIAAPIAALFIFLIALATGYSILFALLPIVLALLGIPAAIGKGPPVYGGDFGRRNPPEERLPGR